jgi:hypothetical protein
MEAEAASLDVFRLCCARIAAVLVVAESIGPILSFHERAADKAAVVNWLEPNRSKHAACQVLF